MAIPKYKKQYEEMIAKNAKLFEDLKSTDPKTDEFRDIQSKLLRILRKNEDILCKKTENTKYLNFSLGLADKFWEEVRANYPEIDY